MSHIRTSIRNALKTLLINANTSAGSRVYTNPLHPLNLDSGPAIVISQEEETASATDIRLMRFKRRLPLKVEARVKVSTTYETALDDLCAEIEAVIAANISLSGNASASVYDGTKFEFSGENKPVAIATLTYNIDYIL